MGSVLYNHQGLIPLYFSFQGAHDHVKGIIVKYDRDKHHRRSMRLKGYDYAQAGAYFITICTHKRACLFGEIINGKMTVHDAGRVAEECWYAIPGHFPRVGLDRFVVMPNHVHGILFISDAPVGAKYVSPLPSRPQGTSKTIGSAIRGFKIGVTKWMRQNTEFQNIWQRNYYDHIIRNEKDLNRIRKYIIENPLQWQADKYYSSSGA